MPSPRLTRVSTVWDLMIRRPSLSRWFQRNILDREVLAHRYWQLAPRFHQIRRNLTPGYISRPLNPFKLVVVDPDRIVRFSSREYPIWETRWQLFGAIMDGTWDQRRIPPVRAHDGVDLSVYLADQFIDTPVHQCLKAHFHQGVAWEETTFIKNVMGRARDEKYDRPVWHTCRTPDDVRQRCKKLDRLYEDIRDRGYLSARRINAETGRKRTFRQVMENEILVDIGRDGELLFVSGRHRLSIAKLLGIEKVPVGIVVRHSEWMDRLRSVGEQDATGTPDDPESVHPDLRHRLSEQQQCIPW